MSIRTISTGQLRRMGDQEGLVLQGCGGDPQEWVDGINEILAQEGILKKGAGFEEAYIMGIASEALRENGMQEQAEEMRNRIFQCQSYDSALSIIGDYVNITAKEQSEELSMEMN